MFQYINVDKLLAEYPNLEIVEYGSNHIPQSIQGVFAMDSVHNEIRFAKCYTIRINLSVDKLPTVKDIGHHIDVNYPHRYTNRELCLGTNTEIIVTCVVDGIFDVYLWFKKFVIPYYYSYEYYNRMGEYPFGERSHGTKGILEYYMDNFNFETHKQAYDFISFVQGHKKYRGHFYCPCGSGKRIRNCHKEAFERALAPNIKERINEDLKIVKRMKIIE